MGTEQSVTRLDYVPLWDGLEVQPSKLKQKTTKKIPLFKTAYHGVWSMHYPDSIAPEPRVGHAYAYDKDKDNIIIAYGRGASLRYLNDIWSLHIPTNKWTSIKANLLSPRSYASGTIIGRLFYIFGGECESKYYNDLHSIDLDTGEVRIVEIPGTQPSPRASAVLFASPDALFLWGGSTNGQLHEAVHILRAKSDGWHRHEILHTGRAAPAYCVHKGNYYIFGSSKGHGLIKFNPSTKSFESLHCTGTEPSHEMQHSAICGVSDYLFVVGGEADSQFMHIYALDLKRNWWFAFHVRPDMESLGPEDGAVNKVGLFMLPREHSATLVYHEPTRTLVSTLGSKMHNPTPTFRLSIGLALAALHMRSDMYEVLHVSIPKIENNNADDAAE